MVGASIVPRLYEAQATEPDSALAGVRLCASEVTACLLENPDLREPLRDLIAVILTNLPDGSISVDLDIDPDDSRKSIVVHVLLPGLDRSRRIAFYKAMGQAIPDHLAGKLVVGVDRG